MDKRGITVWDIIIWIGIALFLSWAVLKALGFIHSPVWVEMIPYFGIGITAIGAAYKLGKTMNGVEETRRKVNHLLFMERRLDEVERTHKQCLNGELKGSPYSKS